MSLWTSVSGGARISTCDRPRSPSTSGTSFHQLRPPSRLPRHSSSPWPAHTDQQASPPYNPCSCAPLGSGNIKPRGGVVCPRRCDFPTGPPRLNPLAAGVRCPDRPDRKSSRTSPTTLPRSFPVACSYEAGSVPSRHSSSLAQPHQPPS